MTDEIRTATVAWDVARDAHEQPGTCIDYGLPPAEWNASVIARNELQARSDTARRHLLSVIACEYPVGALVAWAERPGTVRTTDARSVVVALSAGGTYRAPVLELRHIGASLVKPACSDCSRVLSPNDATVLTDGSNGHYCVDCQVSCERCDGLAIPDEMATVRVPREGRRGGYEDEHWCDSCAESAVTCAHCSGAYSSLDHYCDGCGDICRGCGEDLYFCESCSESYCDDSAHYECGEETTDPWIRRYSDNPDFDLLGAGPRFLGFELEMDADAELAEMATLDLDGSPLTWCKEDSSVPRGFEMVSAPMTLDWVNENFPWEVLDALHADGARHGGNGLHVHVSRAAFSGEAHLGAFLRLIHGNPAEFQAMAGRVSDGYAAFSLGASPADIASKAKGERRHARTSAVNVQNAKTVEVRIFRSSLRPTTVRAALELVDACCVYAATPGAGVTWAEFVDWLGERSDTYPNALARAARRNLVMAVFA